MTRCCHRARGGGAAWPIRHLRAVFYDGGFTPAFPRLGHQRCCSRCGGCQPEPSICGRSVNLSQSESRVTSSSFVPVRLLCGWTCPVREGVRQQVDRRSTRYTGALRPSDGSPDVSSELLRFKDLILSHQDRRRDLPVHHRRSCRHQFTTSSSSQSHQD